MLKLPIIFNFLWNRRLLAAAFLLFAFNVFGLTFSENLPGSRLRVSAPSVDQARELGRYLDLCSMVVDQHLGIRTQPQKSLSVSVLVAGSESSSVDPLRIEYFEHESVVAVTYRVLQGLLRRRTLEFNNHTLTQTATTNWLAAALTNRIVMQGQGRLSIYEPDYQVARWQFAQGHFPRLALLLQGAVTPELPELFHLHMLHCDLLLLCLNSLPAPRGEITRKLLEMEAFGREPAEAATFILGDYLKLGQTLQQWYETTALQVSRQGRRQEMGETLEAKINALQTIAVVQGNAGGKIKKVPLDEMPNLLKDYKLDKTALLNLQKQFLELRQQASPLLHPAFDAYVAALGALANGKERQFRKMFKQARNTFDETRKKQRQIELELNEYEKKLLQPEQRFGVYLEIMTRYEKLRQEIFPDFQENKEK